MRFRIAKPFALLAWCLGVTGVLAPAAQAATDPASSGGTAGPSGTGGTVASGPAAGAPSATPGLPPANGALSVSPGALLGAVVQFGGSLGSSAAGETILIERYSRASHAWISTASTRADGNGHFVARWHTSEAGHFTVRARAQSADAHSAQASDPPSAALAVYEPAIATWYGPGFYGSQTACGERLTATLQGVASRTLPCGTPVEVFYGGRALTVPVVDRGPYSSATWDLTAATAQSLGFTDAGRDYVGTLTSPTSFVRASAARGRTRHHGRRRRTH